MSQQTSVPFDPARVWTDADFAQLRRLAASRLSSGEIGVLMGRRKTAIEGMCRRRRISLPGGTAESPLARQRDRAAAPRLRAQVDARRAAPCAAALDGRSGGGMKEWHIEARRMRALGMPLKEIAATLGKSYDAARDACNPSKIAGHRFAAVRHTDGSLTRRHVPRAIPPKVDPMPACIRYARGEIDLAQLRRELRGQG